MKPQKSPKYKACLERSWYRTVTLSTGAKDTQVSPASSGSQEEPNSNSIVC